MLFNSIEFFLFLPVVFCLYWFVTNRNLRLQNALIVLASYVFYGAWDWRFLGLIFVSSLVDFTIGKRMGAISPESKSQRKRLLFLSLAVNLGILGFFKYCNFFIDSFVDLFAKMGLTLDPFTLQIVLPVGISFYTFQTLSYTIDIYRNQLKPTNDPVAFFAFVSFFPQLVAGPIERAKSLLPQFEKARTFDFNKARDGARQILWGLFQKIVIADNLALAVNPIFADYGQMPGSALVLGLVFFAFQIYCDFAGYSNIAIGTAKLFGFDLMTNFARPYFSRDIGEFWRRWHISLSTWFRDYVYIPLGGSRASKGRQFFNILVTFTVSGFWHGANWTFIAWGALHGLFYLPFIFLGRKKYGNVAAQNSWLPSIREAGAIAATFVLVVLAWAFFRAPTITDAVYYLAGIFDSSLLSLPPYKNYISYVAVLVLIEWISRHQKYPLEKLPFVKPVRWGIYFALLAAIVVLGEFSQKGEFIYFQF